MNKNMKRLLALFLCLTAFVSCLAPAFAAEVETGTDPPPEEPQPEQPEPPPDESEESESPAEPEPNPFPEPVTSPSESELPDVPEKESQPIEAPELPAPILSTPPLQAAKANLSPWVFDNGGWKDSWYIYCPQGSLYSKFSATKGGVTKVAYCLNRELDSPNTSVKYQTAAYPTSRHFQVAKIVAALGYPNNSVAVIKDMFGYTLTATQAQQATQVAIGAAQKAVNDGWSVDKTYSSYVYARSGYQAVFDYSKALCTRALELLNNPKTAAKYSIATAVTVTDTDSSVVVSITPSHAYGNYAIGIRGLPSGTLLTTGQNTRVVDSKGNLSTAVNQPVSGNLVIRGMAGRSGEAVARFTLSAIPRDTADKTLTIETQSYAKLAATDTVEWGKAPDSKRQNMIVAGMAEGTVVKASATALIPKAIPVPKQGSIAIHKQNTRSQPMEGVHFRLTDADGQPLSFARQEDGTWAPAPESSKSTPDLITDEGGDLRLVQLPEGSYTLTETKTAEGYTLLAQPIEITLPLVKSGDESDQPGNLYFDNANHFYDLSYTITNSPQYQLPATGGHGTHAVVLLGVVTISAAVWLHVHKKSKGE